MVSDALHTAMDAVVTFDHLVDIEWFEDDETDRRYDQIIEGLTEEEYATWSTFFVFWMVHQREQQDDPAYDYDRPPYRVGWIW